LPTGGHLAGVDVLRGLEREAAGQRLEQRGLDLLAAPRDLPLQERGQDAEGGEVAGEQVADRDAHAQRGALRGAGQPHETGHALHDLVVARAVPVGALLTETGDARVDEPGVLGRERLVVHAQAMLDVGAIVLDHDVRSGGQALDDGHPSRILQVDRDAALVAVQVRGIEEDPLAPFPTRPLHPDHIGPEVGQDLGAGGPGANRGQVEDREPRERSAGGRGGHGAVV
jgi:hypothetical protein